MISKKQQNQLAENLITNGDFFNKILGKDIKKQVNNDIIDHRYAVKREKIKTKLLKLFISSIDNQSKENLIKLFKLAKSLEKLILKQTGWSINRNRAIKKDNYENQEDLEFTFHNTFCIYRNQETGFYVSDPDKEINSYDAYIKKEEIIFLNSNKKILDELHTIYQEIEKIMSGNYTITNNNISPETMNLIANYLGFETNIAKRETKKL